MDTTVALFFSLGIVMTPADEPAKAPQVETANQHIVQQSKKPDTTLSKRHEQVKKRIAATNAWLASKKQQRRLLAKQHQSVSVALNTKISTCDASWTYT